MSALVCLGAALVAFVLGFALGWRKVRALRRLLEAEQQRAEDLDEEVRRLRLSGLVPQRRLP